MLRIHYIILAHKEPELLKRIIYCLKSNNSTFYIHIDKKTNIKPFLYHISLIGADVHWIYPRYKIKWGHVSIVYATIQAMKTIKLTSENDRVILLSGQDFPVKSNEYIQKFFINNADYNFIEGERFPVKIWGDNCYKRIFNYHIFSLVST